MSLLRRFRRPLWAAAAMLLCLAGAAPFGLRAQGAPASKPRLPKLTLPPVRTFRTGCSLCHGSEGALFDDSLARLGGAELVRTVAEMMRGRAMLKPTEDDVRAMAAYVRSLARKEPFVIVINPAEALSSGFRKVKTEASPGARTQVARVGKALRIRATRRGKTTEIRFPQQVWSHGT